MIFAPRQQQHILFDQRRDIDRRELPRLAKKFVRRRCSGHVHAFLNAPFRNRTFFGEPFHHRVHHGGCAKAEQGVEHRAPEWIDLTQIDFQEVGKNIIGDNACHARLERGRTKYQTAAHRQPDERDLIELEIIQHRRHRLMPLRGHRQPCFVERATLAGAFEGNDFVACVAQIEKSGSQFFDVAVEATEEDDRAFGLGGGEPIRRQHPFVRAIGVGDAVTLKLVEAVHRPHRAQEILARVFPVGVVGPHKEFGATIVVSGSKDVSLTRRIRRQCQKFPLPVAVVRNARRDQSHLLQHARLTDPTVPAVHLEVHAGVRMQLVKTDGEGDGFHGFFSRYRVLKKKRAIQSCMLMSLSATKRRSPFGAPFQPFSAWKPRQCWSLKFVSLHRIARNESTLFFYLASAKPPQLFRKPLRAGNYFSVGTTDLIWLAAEAASRRTFFDEVFRLLHRAPLGEVVVFHFKMRSRILAAVPGVVAIELAIGLLNELEQMHHLGLRFRWWRRSACGHGQAGE